MSHQGVLKKAVAEEVEQLVIFEDDVKFLRRKLWLPRRPDDAVLCYLGFTYKDHHCATRS
jgi:hypothetical protein